MTVEPGVYLPDRGGVRIEDTLIIAGAGGVARPADPVPQNCHPLKEHHPWHRLPISRTASSSTSRASCGRSSSSSTSNPAKARRSCATKLKNVLSGKVVDKTFNAGVKVETATVDRRDATYLYRDGADFVFMDSEDYEQHPLSEALVGDAANFLLESMPVQIAFHNGAPLYLELPVSVELRGDPHRAGPAGRPLVSRHQAGHGGDRRGDPGAVVHQHRRQAQDRHPRRKLPGPRECLTARRAGESRGKAWSSRGRHAARKRAVDLLFEAEARGLTAAEVADSRARLANSQRDVEPLNPYTETVARGVTEHAAHIDDLISSHLQGLDTGTPARGGPRHSAGGRGNCCTPRMSRSRSPWTRPSSWPRNCPPTIRPASSTACWVRSCW